MTCPVCGGKTVVIATKGGPDERIRFRECVACATPFYTAERDIPTLEGKQLFNAYSAAKKKGGRRKSND